MPPVVHVMSADATRRARMTRPTNWSGSPPGTGTCTRTADPCGSTALVEMKMPRADTSVMRPMRSGRSAPKRIDSRVFLR